MAENFNEALFELRYHLRKYRRIIAGVFAVIVALFLLESLFYSVDAREEGVVLRFGRHAATTGPGLHMKLPWPIDRVSKVPVQEIRSLEFGFRTASAGRRTVYAERGREDHQVAEMLTGDLNLANVEWIVQYRISDAARYLFTLGSGDSRVPHRVAVEDTICDASESVMRRLVGDISVDEVLTFGRDRIAGDAKAELQTMLDRFECGLSVVTVKLQSVSPPESVKDAFDAVNRARQNKERIVNEAQGERNRLIPEARGKRDRAIAEAEGYRERTVRVATGQANAFLAQLEEYKKSPEVTRTRLYLEALEELLERVEHKLIIDRSVSSPIPLLNLDQVLGGDAKGGRAGK